MRHLVHIMRKDPHTLALGDIRLDSTPAGPSLGGGAATFAARLAALGRTVRCVGVVGTDSQGEGLLAELSSWGVDISLVQQHSYEATEVAGFETLIDGSFVMRSRQRGAGACLELTQQLREAVDEADIFFWSSATQRDPGTGSAFKALLDASPPSFKVLDIDCSVVIPTRDELEVGFAVASVAHIRGRDISTVCEILGLPDLEPGLLAPAITERYGVSYAVLADPLQGALISSIAGEQVGIDLSKESREDLLGWHEALLAGFVHHVFAGSSLTRCCGAATQYAQAVAATRGSVSRVSDLELESVKRSE